jgi:hypothetical protein
MTRRAVPPGFLASLSILLSAACGAASGQSVGSNVSRDSTSLTKAATTTSSLGAASSFAVLGGSAVTCTDSTVTGDVGVSPGTALTLTSCTIAGGTVHANDTAAMDAARDFFSLYDALALETCDRTLTGTLDGVTLAPGVYCFDAAATLAGVLTLDGPSGGRWVFRIGTSGTGALTGTGFSVVMSGGGQPCNVFWRVAEAATATDSNFKGNILAGAAITLTRGTLVGRALAKAAVTMTGTNVSAGDCAAAPQCTVKAAFDGTVDCASPITGLPNGSFFLMDGTKVLVDANTRIDGESHDCKSHDHDKGNQRSWWGDDGRHESCRITSLTSLKKACDKGQTVEVSGSGLVCAKICPRTIKARKLEFDAAKDDDHDRR